MINSHNTSFMNPELNRTRSRSRALRIGVTVFYTGYLISKEDSTRMINHLLDPMLPPGLADSNDFKCLANSILITPRAAPKALLDKVGGMGKKLTWQVTGTASFENKIWAALLKPASPMERYHTDNRYPYVVLAVRKGARPADAAKIYDWRPVTDERAMLVDTVVGEKAVLRVEQDEAEGGKQHLNRARKRRRHEATDEEILNPQYNSQDNPESLTRSRPQPRHNHHHDDVPSRSRGGLVSSSGSGTRGRVGAGRGRGGGNAAGARGRGRGGREQAAGGGGVRIHPTYIYKSLDDYEAGAEDESSPRPAVPMMDY